MSDDAIHDILEQTESDPAFQALFDLFDYRNYPLRCCFSVVSQSKFLNGYESRIENSFVILQIKRKMLMEMQGMAAMLVFLKRMRRLDSHLLSRSSKVAIQVFSLFQHRSI